MNQDPLRSGHPSTPSGRVTRAHDVVSDATDTVQSAADSAGVTGSGTRRGSPLHRLGQVGFAAQGIVWALLGAIALAAAAGASNTSDATSQGALATLASHPAGIALLVVMGLGLAGYGVWQVVEAVVGHRDKDGTRRVAKRIGAAGKAMLAAVLAVSAFSLALGGAPSGGGEQEGASLVLGLPGGQILLGVIGLIVLGLGVYWVYSGVTARFREKLRNDAPGPVILAGRIGTAAKGVAVGVIGLLVIFAAVRIDPSQAGGTSSAFATIMDLPAGPILLGVIAAGLLAFGAFQIGAARHLDEG